MAVDTVKTRAENVKTSLKDAGYELKDNIVSFISTFGKHLPVENLTKEAKAKEIETEISLLQKEMYPEYMGVKEEDKALLITLAAKLAKLIEAILVDLCLFKAECPKTIEDEKKILSEVIRLKGAYELGGNAKGIKRAQSLETKTLERISLFEKSAEKSAQIRKKIALFQDWANSQDKTSWRNYPILDKFVWTKQDGELEIAKLNCQLELNALKGLSACPKALTTQLEKLVQRQERLLTLMDPNSEKYQELAQDIAEEKALLQYGIVDVILSEGSNLRDEKEERKLAACAMTLERVYKTASDPKKAQLAGEISAKALDRAGALEQRSEKLAGLEAAPSKKRNVISLMIWSPKSEELRILKGKAQLQEEALNDSQVKANPRAWLNQAEELLTTKQNIKEKITNQSSREYKTLTREIRELQEKISKRHSDMQVIAWIFNRSTT